MLYDVFICHASEDKDDFVRPLATELQKSHLEVWYDEFSLKVGDSLRENIDKGLAKSRFGIVVFSPSFFKKRWTKRELNGLVAREMHESNDVILPIWHNVSIKDIIKFSPPLADKKAIISKKGVKAVTAELLRKLRPQESPLIVARDELIYFGLNPPVISNEWWLDIVEASNRVPNGGVAIPEDSMWGRWTFPLPNYESNGEARGVRLAWTAMQLAWEKYADENCITQITHPEIVHDFIKKHSGLEDICHDYPDMLASYAPQLTIKGFSDPFEKDFDDLLNKSILRNSKNNSGTGLTINNQPKLCDEDIALRHPTFGNYQSSFIACNYVQGELMGLHTRYYNHFEYLVWFLSSDSNWLPEKIHTFLIDGMKNWGVWPNSTNANKEIRPFIISLYKNDTNKTYKFTSSNKKRLLKWIKLSLDNLNLKDNPNDICKKFLDDGFIEVFIENLRKRK